MLITEFRVYPGYHRTRRRGHYFTVSIFSTLEEMRQRIKDNGSEWDTSETMAVCQAWRVIKYKRKGGKKKEYTQSYSKELGAILFAEPYMQMHVITHECLHAALRWACNQGLKIETSRPDGNEPEFCSEHEELLCYAHGDLVWQILNHITIKQKDDKIKV